MNILNFTEAQQEAKQLSRNLGKDVEVKPVSCDCDYSPLCYQCGGSGIYYQPVYSFCGHPVTEDDQCEECVEQFREEQEALAVQFEHEALLSLSEVESIREESEAA